MNHKPILLSLVALAGLVLGCESQQTPLAGEFAQLITQGTPDAASQAPARATPQAGPPNIAGSTWAGTDSDGDYYEFFFLVGGELDYKSPTGFWRNATWKQDGKSIYMECNNRYSEYQGTMEGDQMTGQAWNIKGHRWTWVIQKQ
jgi:hypothetical protein